MTLLILRLTEDLKCQIEHFQNPCEERRLRRGDPHGLPPSAGGRGTDRLNGAVHFAPAGDGCRSRQEQTVHL